MPPQQSPIAPAPEHRMRRSVWVAAALIIVLTLGILVGVQLAHSNSDYVCTRSLSDTQQGACTSGSWSSWTNSGGVYTRTYTGTRSTVSYNGVRYVSCSHPQDSSGSSGTITTAYAACQIVQTGTSSATGTTGTGPVPPGSITATSQSETTGAVATSTQTSGTYEQYQNAVDDALATSSIFAAPSILRSGDTSTISWSSSHVRSCTVTGANGDSWPKPTTETVMETQTDAEGNQTQVPVEHTVTPAGTSGSEKTKPITQQTIYTLKCTTVLGRTLTDMVTVTLLPTFQEL